MNNNLNILITDEMHPILMQGLQAANIRYSYVPDVDVLQVKTLMQHHNALIMRGKITADRSFIEGCTNLVFIARAGAGMDNIDLEAANERGVLCFNAGEGNRDAVGEHTVGLLLNLAANINKGHSEVKNGLWDREGNRGFEIGKCTVGIIGFGNTGSAVTEKLTGFGCRVLAYDKYKKIAGHPFVTQVDYKEILVKCDVISFHVPLTKETQDWINSDFINSVFKPFVLLNLSRGGIMNTNDILTGLRSGKVRAFGTDVLENENLAFHSAIEKTTLSNLLSMTNVVVTPHVGGWTKESYKNISEVLLNRIEEIVKNKNLIRKEQYYVR